MASAASFHCEIDGVEGALAVSLVRGRDGVHGAFELEVAGQLVGPGETEIKLDAEALVGRKATVTTGEDLEVLRAGIVERVALEGRTTTLFIVPPIALLSRTRDYRLFLDRTTLEIVTEVLGEHGLTAESRISRALPKRLQCVQAFETDLDFVGRLLADEGVLWHLEPAGDGDSIVLADEPASYRPIEGGETLPYGRGEHAGLVGRESVFEAVLTSSLCSDKGSLRDYDFERPKLDQSVDAIAGPGALEHYAFPGGYKDPTIGRARAQLLLDALRARAVVLSGRTTSRRLRPGMTFVLEGAPRDDMNGRWLVIDLDYEGHDRGGSGAEQRRFSATFRAVPASEPHRPPRSEAPSLGLQTATVTGPPGAEIHTESHGRVTALLRWDRRRPADAQSSHWMRPVHPATSGGFFLPRVGWEVLLPYHAGSADVPYELGRLYNGEAPPPEAVPAKKVRGAFGTQTSPGGGGGNVIRTDDSAGSEEFFVHASKDYNERTEGNKETSVKASAKTTVGSDQKTRIGLDHTVKVGGAQSSTIHGSRDFSANGGIVIEAGSESVMVGGLRLFDVGGDYSTKVGGLLFRGVGAGKAEIAIEAQNRHVTGGSIVAVGGLWVEAGAAAGASVGGASGLSVSGSMNIRAQGYELKASLLSEKTGSLDVTAGGSAGDTFKGAADLSLGAASFDGAKVLIKGKSSLTIKAGGAKVVVCSASITFSAAFSSDDIIVAKNKIEVG